MKTCVALVIRWDVALAMNKHRETEEIGFIVPLSLVSKFNISEVGWLFLLPIRFSSRDIELFCVQFLFLLST